jgi:hypothetical protein
MHNLRVERFFKETMINGRKASADGPIKTFPLRGIKDSPPYLHDDRLLTLERLRRTRRDLPVGDLADELHQFLFHDLLVDLRRPVIATRTGSAV